MARNRKKKTPKKTVRRAKKSVAKPGMPLGHIVHTDAFEAYKIWKVLPRSMWRNLPASDFPKLGLTTLEQDLIKIKNQQQFAQHFSIHMDTVGVWNKHPEVVDVIGNVRAYYAARVHRIFGKVNEKIMTGQASAGETKIITTDLLKIGQPEDSGGDKGTLAAVLAVITKVIDDKGGTQKK